MKETGALHLLITMQARGGAIFQEPEVELPGLANGLWFRAVALHQCSEEPVGYLLQIFISRPCHGNFDVTGLEWKS